MPLSVTTANQPINICDKKLMQVKTNLSQPGAGAESRVRLSETSAGLPLITGVQPLSHRLDIPACRAPLSRRRRFSRRGCEPGVKAGCQPASSRPHPGSSSLPTLGLAGQAVNRPWRVARPAGKQRRNWANSARAEACVCVWWAY